MFLSLLIMSNYRPIYNLKTLQSQSLERLRLFGDKRHLAVPVRVSSLYHNAGAYDEKTITIFKHAREGDNFYTVGKIGNAREEHSLTSFGKNGTDGFYESGNNSLQATRKLLFSRFYVHALAGEHVFVFV